MSYFSEFVGGSAPVGSIVQGPYNLTDLAYLPCDGRKVVRATYPLLSACLSSIGTFTGTSRTKPVTSGSGAICTHGLNYVISGISGGSGGIVTTPDGITFTQRTTPTSTTVTSLISDGTNIVGAAKGALSVYSADSGATFIATATASISTLTNTPTSMAYASALGANGRFCIANINSTQIATSDDRGVTWTLRTHGLGASLMHVCWTGTKYICTLDIIGFIGVSSDGITWSLQAMPFRTNIATTNFGAIISDGAGKVLWADALSALIFTSLDSGATWSKRAFGVMTTGLSAGLFAVSWISFVNGRFFIAPATNSGCTFLSSADLQSWAMVADAYSPNMTGAFNSMAYKSGVYLFNDSSAFCQTIVEDLTKMYLPNGAQSEVGSSNNFLPFIKVQ